MEGSASLGLVVQWMRTPSGLTDEGAYLGGLHGLTSSLYDDERAKGVGFNGVSLEMNTWSRDLLHLLTDRYPVREGTSHSLTLKSGPEVPWRLQVTVLRFAPGVDEPVFVTFTLDDEDLEKEPRVIVQELTALMSQKGMLEPKK